MSYQFYHNALAKIEQEVHDDSPQPGFYRIRPEKGSRKWVPVAIWWGDKEQTILKCTRDGKNADAFDLWTYACRNPVPEDVWRVSAKSGVWPDDGDPAPTIGHNLPTDPLERLKLTLEMESTALTDWLAANPIDSDYKANAIAETKLRLAALGKQAEAERVLEKKPILEAGRAIEAKWQPVVGGFEALTKKINDTVAVYLRAKQEALRLKAEAEAKAAREAEEARRAEIAAAAEALGEPEPELPPIIDIPVEVERARVGNTGAAISLKEVRVAVITDMAAFLLAQQQHPDIVAAANKVAGAIIRSKFTSPGLSYTVETKV